MTDPARTTKDELLPCPFCGAAALLEDDDAGCMNDQCILACFAYPLERWNQRADAADALRAQVAALQEERDETQRLYRVLMDRDFPELRAELAAAQAKLAVPVDMTEQYPVTTRIATATGTYGYHGKELEREAVAMLRDNAALRTQAGALERERDGLRNTFDSLKSERRILPTGIHYSAFDAKDAEKP